MKKYGHAGVWILSALLILAGLSCEPKKRTQAELNAALLEAVSKGDVEQTMALLDEGADPNAKDAQGNSAIISATGLDSVISNQFPKPGIIIALANKGANLNATGASGQTPLGRLAGTCQYSNGAPHYESVISVLISKHADTNARDASGNTPVLNATQQCCTEMLKILLDAGADPNIRNNKGDSALRLVNPNYSLSGPSCMPAFQLLKAAGAKE
jgi:FOG: Ankyrin repeat